MHTPDEYHISTPVEQTGLEVDHQAVKEDDDAPEVVPGTAPEWQYAEASGKEVYGMTSFSSDDGPEVVEGERERKVLGLRRRTFFICAGLAALVVVGVILGACVGTYRRYKNSTPTQSSPDNAFPLSSSLSSASSSPSLSLTTSTPLSTTSSALSPSATTGITANECPGADGQTYNPGPGYVFKKSCGMDWPSGEKTLSGNGFVHDLQVQISYSMDKCIDACWQYNLQNAKGDCAGVTFNSNLTSSDEQGGNCYLKNAVGADFHVTYLSECAALVAGS